MGCLPQPNKYTYCRECENSHAFSYSFAAISYYANV